jgi:2-methylisocitrate lyase-like PEP mutase family enzyme
MRLEAMGYRIAIFPSDTQRAAIYAMKETLAVLAGRAVSERYRKEVR